tara:strand:- start:6694 stop:6906 length:213 start_codon:yes stop_codon:yes gene_type:complete
MEDMAVTSANQIGGYSGVDGDRCSYLNHGFYYLDKKALKTGVLRQFCPIREFLAIWFATHISTDFENWRG